MQRTDNRLNGPSGDVAPEVMRRPRHPAQSGDRESQAMRDAGAQRLAHGLAWFSISLGLAQIVAPRLISRLVGGNGQYANLIRFYGFRELASGLMIFGQGHRPAAAVWSRVAGDAVDIATLAAAGASPRMKKGGVAWATAGVLGVTALDVYCARELSRERAGENGIRMSRSVVVNRPPHELYAFWRTFENFPRFMYHVQSVRTTGPGVTHWVVNGPAGTTVEWDARITCDTPNERISWQTLEGTDVESSGSVRFEPRPGNRGTIVRVDLEYRPPGGKAGKLAAMLFNESPEQQIYDDLHRFKQIVETGEIVRSDGSPEGIGDVRQRPGQPSGERAGAYGGTAASSAAPAD
ncbi:MAG TPA: SRPBCC family protein [Casimicrobiaceae bacterium]|nr:SRPBCC family protein [Casimicrobiaceae bacterium]